MKETPPGAELNLAQITKLREGFSVLTREIGKVFVGQSEVVEELVIALLCRGHVLLEGVPGLGKTLLISTLAEVLNLSFRRIQFTPDLMPSDITGTDVFEEDPETMRRTFRFIKGPLFANIVLADEVNRTPPKTQSALLEAMQERSVTVAGRRFPLEPPFFVLATQNPIEQEGTYPLPEAQLDRFMLKVSVSYPSQSEEEEIVMRTTADLETRLDKVLGAEEIVELQRIVRRVPVSQHVVRYAVSLARNSRPNTADSPKFVNQYVDWGAGPRASQFLILAGKARALLKDRFHVAVEDVTVSAPSVLRHRLLANFAADAENISIDEIIRHLIAHSKPPEYS